MNSTDKLLRAFIEASGYEIEEVKTFHEAQYLVKKEDYEKNPADYKGAFAKSHPFKEAYTDIDYKVTKNGVNYKQLIDKYVGHIAATEGSSFIFEAEESGDFTKDEIKVLLGDLDEKT